MSDIKSVDMIDGNNAKINNNNDNNNSNEFLFYSDN